MLNKLYIRYISIKLEGKNRRDACLRCFRQSNEETTFPLIFCLGLLLLLLLLRNVNL